MTRARANLLLLLAGATWGMGFVAQSRAMDDIGPFTFVAARFIVALLVITPFVLRESRRHAASAPVLPSQLASFALVGLMLFLGMATQQVGLLTTSVTNSGFLTGLYVVMTPIAGILLFGQRPPAAVWPAAVLALGGIALLSGGDPRTLVIGDLLTVFSAMFWALQVVLIARFVGASARPLALSAVQFAVTALLAAALALALEPLEFDALWRALPSILYAGVFASGFAFTLQVIGQRWTSAPQAAIMLSSEAPFAALFGVLLLGERFTALSLAGCALILAGMLLVELWPAREASVQPQT